MKDGMRFKRGEIVLIPFPFSDITANKKRPALIISGNKLHHTQDRLCVLITSNPDAEGMMITKKAFAQGTLPFASKVKPQRVFAASTAIILKTLCTVTEEFTNNVVDELNKYIH